VILSPSYDAADSSAQAATEQLLYENKDTKDFSVWKTESLIVRPAAMNRLYKSHTCMSDERFAVTKQDLKTIDPCQIFICVEGAQDISIGKIFIDYDVEFFEPHSPTEAPNQGGAVVDFGASNPNSNTPFQALPAVQLNEANPVLKTVAALVNEGILVNPTVSTPTGVVGQFLKDYKGIMALQTVGTGVTSSSPALGAGSTPTGPADRFFGGVLGNTLVNAAGTISLKNFFVDAAQGEYLKAVSGVATTISSMNMQMAGTSII